MNDNKKPMFVYKNKLNKIFCPVENCKFKSAKKRCLFYFEYKDGSATCANAKELAKEQQKRKLEEAVKECEE